MTTPTKFDRHADVLVQVEPNTITFGIEVECLLPTSYLTTNGLRIGGHFNSHYHLPAPFENWKLTSDSSLISERGYSACEIVSPVLTGLDGLKQVHALYTHLVQIGFKVNDSCGTHVHIGLMSLMGNRYGETKLRARVLRRLVNLVSQHEAGLLAITGNRARIGNFYCKSIKALQPIEMEHGVSDIHAKLDREDRYHLLNLQNLNGPKQTVEFRVFAGTACPNHAIGYILTAMGLCQRACEVPAGPKFNAQTVAPDYKVEAEALIKRLGWHNGRRFGVPANGQRLLRLGRQALRDAAQRFAH